MGNYECSICCVKFGNRNELTDHLVNVYHRQKIDGFECGACSGKFRTIGELENHVAYSHATVITQ
ncbi:MAG: hypothetical protein ABR981_01630 [Candidatus Micrarchaeaceae archaeon]|jgi:hypothetical protein